MEDMSVTDETSQPNQGRPVKDGGTLENMKDMSVTFETSQESLRGRSKESGVWRT